MRNRDRRGEKDKNSLAEKEQMQKMNLVQTRGEEKNEGLKGTVLEILFAFCLRVK